MTQYKTFNLSESEKEKIFDDFLKNYYALLQEHNKFCYSRTNAYVKQVLSEDDILQELVMKFLEKDLVLKYDSSKTSLSYFIAVVVKRHYIDTQRKYEKKGTLSLNASVMKDQDAIALASVTDKSISERTYLSKILTEEFISKLPNVNLCTLEGYHPDFGSFRLTAQNLVRLLTKGYSAQDIADCFYNPASKKSISVNRIRSYIKDLKTYVKYNELLADI